MMRPEAEAMMHRESYTAEDLLTIMKILRQPDGCPWDREQTHESIRQNLIEETYEAVEAIDTGNRKLLCEELGDVLMQVVFHSVMAEEKGDFTFSDVLFGVCRKLIYRHPHVFGEVTVGNSREVLSNWDKLKSQEKTDRKTTADKMRAIPPALPALMRTDKLSARAAKVGFDFPSPESAADKVQEELAEVLSAGTPEERKEELGDLLFSAANLCRLYGFSAEEALEKANRKFVDRFAAMEDFVSEKGEALEELDAQTLENYWKIIKINKNS